MTSSRLTLGAQHVTSSQVGAIHVAEPLVDHVIESHDIEVKQFPYSRDYVQVAFSSTWETIHNTKLIEDSVGITSLVSSMTLTH